MEREIQQSGNKKKSVYHCPMRCEDEKVYDHPGNCPVCNMKLVPAIRTVQMGTIITCARI